MPRVEMPTADGPLATRSPADGEREPPHSERQLGAGGDLPKAMERLAARPQLPLVLDTPVARAEEAAAARASADFSAEQAQRRGTPAPAAERLRFCLCLGWFSFAFAELSIGSTPSIVYPVFQLTWNLAVTWPLYMSHTVLILTALVRCRRASGFETVPPVCLWLGGQLLALYEAFITKVLFRPSFSGFPGCGANFTGSNATEMGAYCHSFANRTDWAPMPGAPMQTLDDPACGLYIGGIALPQFATLVLYYHPLWSFLVPCLLCEWLLCAPLNGRFVTLPRHVLPGCQRHGTAFFASACGRRSWRCCAKAGIGIVACLLVFFVVVAQFPPQVGEVALLTVIGLAVVSGYIAVRAQPLPVLLLRQ